MTGPLYATFGLAVVSTAAAAGLRALLGAAVGGDLPYLTFFAAIMVTAWYGGLWPGLTATALGTAAALTLFVAPDGGITAGDWLGAAVFVATGVVISGASERLHAARRHIERQHEALGAEVDARLRAAETRRLEAERLRATLHSVADGVLVTDAAGRITSINPVAERLTGWPHADALGRPVSEIFRTVDDRGAREPDLFQQVLDTNAEVRGGSDAALVGRDGTRRPIDRRAAPIRDEHGGVVGAVLVFHDVGERRRADEALRQSEDELSDFFENLSVGLLWLDQSGRVLRANHAELAMLGYDAAEFVGHNLGEFHDDPAAAADLLRQVEAGKVLRQHPARLRCRDGTVKDVLISSSVRWEGGRFAHARAMTIDVSEQQRAERARALLAAVVESSEDAILTKTLDGRILSWNAGAEQMFGYTAAAAVGRLVSLIVPPHRRHEEADLMRRVSAGERVLPFETERVARGGGVIDVSATLSPIRDDDGRIVAASSIARDIGPRKALEASLREADRRKDDFLAVLAHELRNPLAPIRSSVAVLQHAGNTTASAQRAAEVIDRQARHMARLLDDLLDVSRITRDKLALRREPVVLGDVVDAAVETARPLLESRGHPLTLALPPTAVHLHGDAVRLSQVFSNLLSNAAKYSDPGAPIAVTAEVQGGEVVVEVRDRGIGIEPDMLPRLFEMFSQAAQAVHRAQGGLGIGLALVRGLVELHGGRIEAASAGPGQGSRFSVWLPVADAPAPATEEARPSAPASLGRILVVDDNRDAADSLSLLLRAMGHEVRTVYDGPSAVDAAAAFRPRVVLLDLGMPDVDGFSTARQLRAAMPGAPPYLVAITGWGQERDRRQTAADGFDAHFVKPVEPAELSKLLQTVLG